MVHEDESSDDYSSLQYMNSSDDDIMLYRVSGLARVRVSVPALGI